MVPRSSTDRNSACSIPDNADSRKAEGEWVTSEATKVAGARGPQILVHKMVTRGRSNSDFNPVNLEWGLEICIYNQQPNNSDQGSDKLWSLVSYHK